MKFITTLLLLLLALSAIYGEVVLYYEMEKGTNLNTVDDVSPIGTRVGVIQGSVEFVPGYSNSIDY